jgi:hypothetical protein
MLVNQKLKFKFTSYRLGHRDDGCATLAGGHVVSDIESPRDTK